MCLGMGMCPACREYKQLNEHHIFCRRAFGKKNNDATIMLCQRCHSYLDSIIPYNPRKEQCLDLLIALLQQKIYPQIKSA
jgi:ribosomal protein L37E